MHENPWAYDEARNRIREKQEQEKVTVERKKAEYEIGREKVFTRKKLDVWDLRRKIETGHSLSLLKDEVRQALDEGSISLDTYNTVIEAMRASESMNPENIRDFLIDPNTLPLSQNRLAQYLEQKKIGENIFVDMAGFAYGFTQGSVFLLFLLGKIILDFLLLPRDIYMLTHE